MFGNVRKTRAGRVILAVTFCVLVYLAGAFVVTPPYSPHGFYSVPGCACGHHSFATVEGKDLMVYRAGHHARESLGRVSEMKGVYKVILEPLPPLHLRFTFWGCLVSEGSDKTADFYPRDFLYPIALLTKLQTEP